MDIYLQVQTQSFQHHIPVGKWQNLQSKFKKISQGRAQIGPISVTGQPPLHWLWHLKVCNALIVQLGVGLALSIQVSRGWAWRTGVAKIKIG